MRFFVRTIGALHVRYLIRAYLLGFIIFSLMTLIVIKAPAAHGGFNRFVTIAYFLICTALFPVAKFAWDELRDMIVGNSFFFMNALFLLAFKLATNLVLWIFAPFVAPFGLLYLWFQTASTSK